MLLVQLNTTKTTRELNKQKILTTVIYFFSNQLHYLQEDTVLYLQTLIFFFTRNGKNERLFNN